VEKSILRVGVDFHAFDGKFQGSRSHLIGLYRAMVELSPDIQFVFFLHDVEGLRRTPGFDRANVSMVHMGHANPLVRLGWQLPRLRRQHRIDILHTQYIAPLGRARGNAVTIHDILFEDYPQFFTPFFVWRSKLLFKRSARSADMVMTVSEYSRGEIASKYGVPAGRIGLLLNAVDPLVFHPDEGRDTEVLARRGLQSGRYLLTVGRIEPRKDHATLMQAYAMLGKEALPLVIVGQRDFGYGAFDAALAALPSREAVHVLSDVGDAELPALLRHAHTFIYPSLAEGFGMPPLEAMASGVPVIVANSTALPEVVGDAGRLFSPGNARELAARMRELLLAEPALRAQLVAKGLQRARSFSWLGSAQVLRETFLRWRQGSM
jgi:glycosyltransferase involved in cell wall biosynthesis